MLQLGRKESKPMQTIDMVCMGQTVEKAHVNARRADDLASSKSPRQSFSIRGWKNKSKSVFFGDMSIEKNTSQPASVESGRPLTRFCAQRAASPRKNACIFEKRVELFRHARSPCRPYTWSAWASFMVVRHLPAARLRCEVPGGTAAQCSCHE